MTARFLVGDVHDRLADIPDQSVDLILTSPPFLALRSYLPDNHPDKAKEIGSEPTPAAFIDVLLQLTAEWGRVLAPHGSIAVELGDTYAGSGGAGGDYLEDGLREGQPRFRQRNDGGQYGYYRPDSNKHNLDVRPISGGPGWPLPKSLACIPQLYQVALAYGINPLTGRESPAGRWRVRTLKPWIRSNPPVGALGDKERPATSYVIVACRAQDRWFDLDAVRTQQGTPKPHTPSTTKARSLEQSGQHGKGMPVMGDWNAVGGAPPRDWWHHVDAVLDTELAARAKDSPRHATPPTKHQLEGHGRAIANDYDAPNPGAQGVHLRRALERAGILTTQEALDVSPKGYAGAHYAVWPPELVRLLVNEMCPRRVCTRCGEPSRRIVETSRPIEAVDSQRRKNANGERPHPGRVDRAPEIGWQVDRQTLGWSDCGHQTWRPGHVLDPFAGSGTTLAVCTGMARDATGIDIDERNAWLAQERCGMFLEIDHPTRPIVDTKAL